MLVFTCGAKVESCLSLFTYEQKLHDFFFSNTQKQKKKLQHPLEASRLTIMQQYLSVAEARITALSEVATPGISRTVVLP